MGTLKTAYMVQFDSDGEWVLYSADEMTEPVARKLASEIFDGQVPTRLVKVEWSVMAPTEPLPAAGWQSNPHGGGPVVHESKPCVLTERQTHEGRKTP